MVKVPKDGYETNMFVEVPFKKNLSILEDLDGEKFVGCANCISSSGCCGFQDGWLKIFLLVFLGLF